MNSWVLITGASGGLGKAFAVECASRGWNIFLTDLDLQKLQILAESLHSAYNVRVQTAVCDLSNADSRAKLFTKIRRANLKFWALINVAGLDYEGVFFERTRQQIRSILRVNIEATVEVTHAVLEYRDPLAAFRIINVASLAAFYPMPVKATYAASKRFLVDFSLALREELRPIGATVTVLCPAGLPTKPDTIEAINAQGWMGHITTQDIGKVAAQTIDHALKGDAVYIPGLVNRILHFLGGLLPPTLIARLVGNRWKMAHQKRSSQSTLNGQIGAIGAF